MLEISLVLAKDVQGWTNSFQPRLHLRVLWDMDVRTYNPSGYLRNLHRFVPCQAIMIFSRESCIHNLQMFEEKLSRIALILVCKLFSANKCPLLYFTINWWRTHAILWWTMWAHRASLVNQLHCTRFAQLRNRQVSVLSFCLLFPRKTVFFSYLCLVFCLNFSKLAIFSIDSGN